MRISRFSKWAIMGSVMASTLFLIIRPSYSALTGFTTDRLLAIIANNTYAILEKMNETPAYFGALTEMAESWLETNDDVISNNQYVISLLAGQMKSNVTQRINLAKTLTNNFLLAGSSNTSNPTYSSNPNELNYTVLYGQKLVSDSSSISSLMQKYVTNASGSNLILQQTNPEWKDSNAKKQYDALYKTLASMQSYNQYLIVGLYKSDDQNETAQYLIDQANSSGWFKKVATEPLGVVLRHLLMFSSQSYVQMDRLLQLQKQQLAVQAMTNELIIIMAQSNVGQQLALQARQAS